MKKKIFTPILVLALLLISSTALAGNTYLDEDFESTLPLAYPDTFDDSSSESPYHAEVIEVAGNNWFSIEQRNTTPSERGYSDNTAALDIDPNETQLTAEFVFMSLMDAGTVIFGVGTEADGYLVLYIYADGSVAISRPEGPPVQILPAGTITDSVEHDIKIVANFTSSDGELYVDSVLLADELSLTNPPEGYGNNLLLGCYDSFYGDTYSAQAFFDDVVVTGAYEAVNPRTGDTVNYAIYIYAAIILMAFAFAGFAVRRKVKN